MVDSNVKKSRFIQQAILELGLIHASVVHSRAEQFQPRALFDGVVSRAFSSLSQFLSLAAPLLSPGGQAIAMKGKWSKGEEERGIATADMEELRGMVRRASAGGLASFVHAIGDRANREMLDIFAAVRKEERARGEGHLRHWRS